MSSNSSNSPKQSAANVNTACGRSNGRDNKWKSTNTGIGEANGGTEMTVEDGRAIVGSAGEGEVVGSMTRGWLRERLSTLVLAEGSPVVGTE